MCVSIKSEKRTHSIAMDDADDLADDLELQRAVELSLQEALAASQQATTSRGEAESPEDETRKRRHSDSQSPDPRAPKSQNGGFATSARSGSEPPAGSVETNAAAHDTTEEAMLQEATALSLQDAVRPQASAPPANAGPQGAVATAAQLQAILAQVQSSLSSENPFAGLFAGGAHPAAQATPNQAAAGNLGAADQRPSAQPQTLHNAATALAGSQPVPGPPSPPIDPEEPEPWWGVVERWWGSMPALSPASTSDIEVRVGGEARLGELLTSVLGVPAVVRRAGALAGTRPPPGGVVVHVTVRPERGDSLWLGTGALDAVIKSRVSAANLRGAAAIQILADCYARAEAMHAGNGDAGGVAAPELLARLGPLLAHHALVTLQRDDEDDLYFTDGGQQTRQLLDGLSNGTVSDSFLAALLGGARSPKVAATTWDAVLKLAFDSLSGVKLVQTEKIGLALRALDALLRQPALQHLLAATLIREVMVAPQTMSAAAFERAAILAPLLQLSSIPDTRGALSRGIAVDTPALDVFTEHRTYGRPGEARVPQQSVRHVLWQLYNAAHEMLSRMARQKLVQPKNGAREALLAWLAAAINKNSVRSAFGEERRVIELSALVDGSSDGFAVGLTVLCLKFSQWLQKGDLRKHIGLLQPSYYGQNSFRWHDYSQQTALTGHRIECSAQNKWLMPDRDPASALHFAAECFFLMQLSMHHCLLPTVNRFEQVLQVAAHEWDVDTSDRDFMTRYQLLQDCTHAQLLDPDFAGEVVKFVHVEAAWLDSLMRQDEDTARAAFRAIPDFVVKDMAGWLSFVIRHGAAELLGGLPTDVLMDAITGMLLRQDLVGSAVVQSHLVELLRLMLAPQMDGRRQIGGRRLGPTALRPGEAQLVAAVYGTGATQTRLVPALMRAFAAADHVIGLDVDRDRFDKFTFRDTISSLLTELWKDPGCMASLTRLAEEAASTSEAETFSDFVGALVNSLIYLLEDSLLRLADIHNIEAARRDEATWNAASQQEIETKERFYKGQQRTTTGFMQLAWRSLSMLKAMAKDPVIRRAFWEQPLVKRFAYASVRFINKLAGPAIQNMEVENPEQYHFFPAKLLADMAELVARLSESGAFVRELAQDDDYDAGIMHTARGELGRDQQIDYEIVARLERVIDELFRVQSGSRELQVAAMTGAQAVSGGAAMDEQSLSFEDSEPEGLAELYRTSLAPSQIDVFDSTAPGAYNREFLRLAEQKAGDTQAKMRRLAKEMRDLPKLGLTLELAGAIFLRHDEDRLDIVRAMIVGPEDTPYAGGCFHFDLFFPPDYPHVPPLMMLETTGLGRARFHPNLYADGKVCLSLLGTFHGTDASEKWDPSKSSLYQILMSVLGLIFVSDPYFAEPNVEIVRGTREGKIADSNYNSEVVVNTVRYAMLDQLRRPRPGFEAVTLQHFRMQRHRIMAFCRRWLQESDSLRQPNSSFVKSIQELHKLLANL